jgi:hypothetical protein
MIMTHLEKYETERKLLKVRFFLCHILSNQWS